MGNHNFFEKTGLPDGNPFLIAEVAQAHDGSLGTAHAFIDAIADAGGSAIKFQTHIAEEESTLDEPWRVRFSEQDSTRYDYWKRMEFTQDQWIGLEKHATERGLIFISSPFSPKAVAWLEHFNMPFWKIASGEIENIELMDAVWKTERPIVFSSGMSSIADLDYIIDQTRSLNIPYAVLQCTSAYPCPPDRWGLNQMALLAERYNCPSGFSDHSGNIYAGLAAAALGAQIIEVHVTFHQDAFGPDVKSSVTIEEFQSLAKGSREIREALSSQYTKDKNALQTSELKKIFGRSWALKNDLPAGSIIGASDIILKKPGTGIPYSKKSLIVGKRLRHDKPAARLIEREDIE